MNKDIEKILEKLHNIRDDIDNINDDINEVLFMLENYYLEYCNE